MSRIITGAISLIFFATSLFAATAKPQETPTQMEFAKRLIDTFGWAEGLPENPQEKDYLAILNGNRSFSFEAENCYDKVNDSVVIRNYPLFGKFSGDGWVHAATARTAVHFKIFIPVEGKYTFKVSAKGDDQLWSIAGKAFKLNAGVALKESTLGEVTLTSGTHEFNAVIPSGGAIDSFSLYAPDFHPVAPAGGWNFSAPLTAEAANEIAALLLNLDGQLPEDSGFTKRLLEASATELPPEALLTDNRVYGKTASARWVRFPQKGGTLSLPFNVVQPGVYTLRIRAMGEKLAAGFDAVILHAQGKPYLEWVDAGTFRLDKGMHSINIRLPAGGGADAVEIGRKLASAKDYASMIKFNISDKGVIKTAEMESILKTLQEQFKERR